MQKPEARSIYWLPLLESFDSSVFIAEDKQEQAVCGFVLMLALIYNDLRDIMFLLNLHLKDEPKIPKNISTEAGHYAGLNLHGIRLIQMSIYETLYLIKGRQATIDHPLFQSTIQALGKKDKQCWSDLINAATNKPDQEINQFREFLDTIRDKITAHYVGIDQLVQGYKLNFFDRADQKPLDAYISRGSKMSESRFYFADAAVQGLVKTHLTENENEFRDKMREYVGNINRAIYSIVEKFINNVRGAAWVKHET